MGRPFSSLKREVMNYNIENRASKFISKDKSVPSPKHPSTVEQTKILKEEYGITIEDVSKKDEKLNKHLRNIYVVSEGPALSSESTKALPLNRITDWSDMQYGYREPEVIPAGKISLKRALELLSKYHEGGGKWTYDNLAKHYNLNVKFVVEENRADLLLIA
ncbi:NADH dehydrogenase [ubiquinone] 1 alpha subcomplex assembly factor 4 isoform X2 [Lycorma delicatula]|uniref:NADH dehydrogenase [ubiquinone] 1 alpha subcomplex assembly factor 4 isoform X2 n=1 Tax=Lycorma delicatula TaxID=130591 RepID=UPI003F518466